MHTDEYEISVGREIVLCRKVIDRLTKALREKEKKYGMSTEEFLTAFMEGRLLEIRKDFGIWAEDARELENWRKKLRDYEEALKMLKHI